MVAWLCGKDLEQQKSFINVSPQIACLNRCMLTLATFVAVLVIGLWWDGARCGHQPNKPQSQFQFTPRQKVLEIVGHEAESSGIILHLRFVPFCPNCLPTQK